MAVDLSGRLIFLATPGGMDDKRRWVREEVALFNQSRFRGTAVMFVVTGYEDVAGTVGRPQAAINRLVEEADFMILLIGGQLGSPTTATAPFQTGIEEEFSVALGCLGVEHAPMRDVLLAFSAHPTSALRQPSQDVREVLEFKNAIEATKELLHIGSFEDEAALREKLRIQLEQWAQPLRAKTCRSSPALLAALDGTTRPKMAQPAGNGVEALVQWAEEKAAEGLNTVADIAFAKAVAEREPDHMRRYARFLQRTGHLKRAVELDKQALEVCIGGTTVEKVRLQADLLAHLALLKRKLGDPDASKRLLDEAVLIARAYAQQITPTMAYILDQSGIAAARRGDLDSAAEAYAEAHDLRKNADDESGRAQSLINLARVAGARGETADGITLLNEAISILGVGDETRVLANALAALGDAVSADDPDRARDLLTRSLGINERLGIPDGISVTSNGLARLALSIEEVPTASLHAERVLEVSSKSGNREGTLIAYRLLGEINLMSGKPQAAVSAFRNALDLGSAQHDPAREAQTRLGLARSLTELGEQPEAAEHIKVGRRAATKISDTSLIAEFDELTASISN